VLTCKQKRFFQGKKVKANSFHERMSLKLGKEISLLRKSLESMNPWVQTPALKEEGGEGEEKMV
jgi:hypothetical protein